LHKAKTFCISGAFFFLILEEEAATALGGFDIGTDKTDVPVAIASNLSCGVTAGTPTIASNLSCGVTAGTPTIASNLARFLAISIGGFT
jgi:hypothetical protein